MGEAAFSYWLEEFINPTPQPADADLEYTAQYNGETDEDWMYGSD
jgi:hypothetical protein